MTKERVTPSPAPSLSAPEAAREAMARHAWREAFEILSEADARGELAPGELELLAQAAWWTGQLPVAIETRERAYGRAVKSGETPVAVMAAIALGRDNLFRNDLSVAGAWLNRAQHLLEGVEENVAHGWLAATRAFASAIAGNTDETLAQAGRAEEIARRLGDRDLMATARSERGFGLIAKGQMEEGLALIDEATVSAVSGELEPSTAGGVCCTTIEACAALGDWIRAASWTEAQDRWCRREGINGYPGMCRVYRSEIKQLRGLWLEAEAEARQASLELQGFIPSAAGLAFYRIGELRRLRGDLPAAEEALLRAHALGNYPEPALSYLRLAQGKAEQAASSIRRALDEPPKQLMTRAPADSDLYRLPMLRAQVEIALAAGDLPTARGAADELGGIAERFGSTHAQVAFLMADGAVRLAEGDATGAAQRLRRAVDGWTAQTAPYESARARVQLAEAYLAEGGHEQAVMELQVARSAFEQLGAAPDLRQVDEQLGVLHAETSAQAADATERVVRTFAFTDIVGSTRLAEVLGDDGWRKLMRWHDQTIRGVVAEYGGEEIKATGDGFFVAFADPASAIEAMIAVQRRLAQHRESQGFAPAVRIGVHTAEASRSGLDYVGMGVNYAARIGGAAQGGEILVSSATVDATRRSFAESGRRELQLRGISEPVSVASVNW